MRPLYSLRFRLENGRVIQDILGVSLSWSEIRHTMSKFGIAFVLAIPIAWDRETSTRGIGL